MENTTNPPEWVIAAEPQVKEFGPCRVIGMNYIGKNQSGEIPALWHSEKGFIHRVKEIQPSQGAEAGLAFGICRCVPGKIDGSFEYIAAITAAPDASIPEGMMEVQLLQSPYVIFTVRNLTEIGKVWEYAQKWFAANPQWEGYCTPKGCDCVHYPSFELYPADFTPDGKLYIYFPVKAK
jgi:predicted transcriptional regulator YdeE